MATKWKELLQCKPHELVITGKTGSKQLEDEDGLNEILFKISSLNFLEVSLTGLNSLPSKIEQLSNLTNLVLHGNKLKELPASIGKLKKLKLLDVSRNEIESLPNELSQLTDLQSLLLSGNKLESLPEDLSLLCGLLVVKIDHNNFSVFPASLLNEDNPKVALTEIHGQANKITSIPSAINRLVALKLLDLRDNQLTVIPGELGDCTKLKDVLLNGNKLTDRRFLKLVEQNKTKQVMDYIRAHFPRGKGKESEGNDDAGDGKPLTIEARDRKNAAKDARRRRRSTSRSSRSNSECTMDTIKILSVKEEDWFFVTASPAALDQRKIVACIVKNVDLKSKDGTLKKFLTLQSNLHDGVCGKRQLATIAVHDLDKIGLCTEGDDKKRMIYFDVKPPSKLRLTPLNRNKEMSATELYKLLMEEAENVRKEKKRNTFSGIHKYLYLLKGKSRYSCLLDGEGHIISFPPITNSERTKLTEETNNLLIEVTGESQPTCKKVLDALLHSMVKLGLGADGNNGHDEKKDAVNDITDGVEKMKMAADVKPHLLHVEPVKVVDSEGKLYVVYPSRPDLLFDDINIVRT